MSKRFILLLSGFLVASPGVARAEPGREQAAPQAEESKPGREIKGEVVSVDSEGKTITLKEEALPEGQRTLTVEGKALANLKDFKAGDKVVLTCKASEGEASSSQPGAKPEAGSAAAEPAGTKPCVVTGITKPTPEKK